LVFPRASANGRLLHLWSWGFSCPGARSFDHESGRRLRQRAWFGNRQLDDGRGSLLFGQGADLDK